MDLQFLWGLVALICGGFIMSYGSGLFRFVLAFAGFYIGFSIGMRIGAPTDGFQIMLAVVLGGILGAVLYFLVKLTVYFAGAIFGLVLGLLIVSVFGWQDTTMGWIIGLAGLGLGGFFGPRLGDLVLVLAAAGLGAYAAVMGITMLLVDQTSSSGMMPSTAAAFIVFLTLAAVSTLTQMQIRDLRRRLIR